MTEHKLTNRYWHLVDAQDQTLGRLATRVASLLIGKHKATFSASLDSGDYVVVINTDGLKVTGKKLKDKIYYRYSGFPDGLYQKTLGEKMNADSTDVLRLAVKGMLPKNKQQDRRLVRLKIYKGSTHPYINEIKSNA